MKTAIDNTDVDFAEALNNPSELPRFAEVQVTQWQESMFDVLTMAQDYLIPEGIASVALDY